MRRSQIGRLFLNLSSQLQDFGVQGPINFSPLALLLIPAPNAGAAKLGRVFGAKGVSIIITMFNDTSFVFI